MADKFITELTAVTTPTDDDLMVVEDAPSGTPETKKITWANVKATLKTYFDTLYSFMSSGGWYSAATWTYASSSTFTVSGDVTAIYRKGTRLKWTQTTVKYGVVVASSYSSPNTTVTIAVNSDYTIASAAISANYYSHILSPEGYPDYFNFATTHGGFSANPSYIMHYSIHGHTCHIVYAAYSAGTSNATTYTVVAPVTALNLSNYSYYGVLSYVLDNGSGAATGLVHVTTNSATLDLYKSTGAAWTNSGNKLANFTLDIEF